MRPDVVIVDALLQGRVSGQQVAQQIREAEPQVGVIMLTVPQNPVSEDPERGIDAVLKMPFTGFDLTTLVRKVGETRAVESARAGSLVVTLFSPKGGVGRTTLAYNLAVALGQEHRVCLVDGSLQFSDLRGLLRVPAVAPSIVNLPTDRIREQDLAEVMWRDPSGIDILLAPPRVEMAEMVTTARRREGALAPAPALRVRDHRHPRRAERRRARLPRLRRPHPPGPHLRQHGDPQPGDVGGDVRAHRLPAVEAPDRPEPGRCRPAASTRPTSSRRSAARSTSRSSPTAASCSRRTTRGSRSSRLSPEAPIAQGVRRIADSLAATSASGPRLVAR